MLSRITHKTRYTYEGPVSHCLTEARLTPRLLPGQKLLEWQLNVAPEPSAITSRLDYFGNDVSSFAVFDAHMELVITASGVVELHPPDQKAHSPRTTSETRAYLASLAEPAALRASEFTWESPFVPWLAELEAYSAPTLAPERPVLEAAQALMTQVYRDFAYTPKATSIETPLSVVMENRQGVCQDFAHVMIGALRAHGLAARYVSGYLHNDAGFEGAGASHAWVSVFAPGVGWVDYDPTNNVQPAQGHITLALGRDFGDVTPVKGITVGGGAHTLEVDVRVVPA
jgi:transglutaminase-like putative cysteine protease